MEIPENPRIAIVGGGSWATAIAKILLETNEHINWFMRNIETINAFKELNHNPRYLCSVDFDLSRISFTDNLDKLIARSKMASFRCPASPFMASSDDSFNSSYAANATNDDIYEGIWVPVPGSHKQNTDKL